MRTKRIIVFLLALVMTFGLCGAMTACKEEGQSGEAQLTIDSKTEATIEVGESYTLVYTSKGTVTVTASGGTYDDETHKFSAEAAGTYTLTVKAVEEGKKDTVKTVTITVTEGANKTALQTAYDSTSTLKQGDYTSASWSKLTAAKSAASEILEGTGYTQAEVDDAKQAIEDAVKALAPAAIEKATVTDDSIAYNGKTYFAVDYKNFAAIKTEVDALNKNASVKLRSEYSEKIAAILAKLNAKLMLQLSGLMDGTVLFVESLETYTLTATSDAGVTYEWKLNGTVVANNNKATYDFAPEAFDTEYTVSCKVTKGTESNEKSITVSFKEVGYKNNMGDGIAIDGGTITVTKSFDWGANEGKKVTLPDLYLKGDFSVYFDVTFTKHEGDPGNANVMAIFLLDKNGDSRGIWVAVCEQNGWLEVTTSTAAGDVDKIRKTMPQDAWELDHTMHIRMTRKTTGDTTILTADLLDDNGNVLFHNDAISDKDSNQRTVPSDVVMLGIQAEHASFRVENLGVNEGAEVVNLSVLRALVDANASKYPAEDYNANDLQTALTAANALLAQKENAEADAIEDAVAELRSAIEEITLKDVVKAEIAEDDKSFTYAEKTYSDDKYENFATQLALVKTLNADGTVTKNSEYRTRIQAIIDGLVPFVKVTIKGVENRVYLVETLPEFVTLEADTLEGASIEWTVNGEKKGTLKTLQFAPEFKEYTVQCKVSHNDKESEAEVKFTYRKTTYKNNTTDGITIEDNVIKVTKSFEWGDPLGTKVVLDGLYLDDFDVYFDLKFTEHRGDTGNTNVMALFLLDENGNPGNNSERRWFAVCEQNGWLEVAFADDNALKIRGTMPSDPEKVWKIGNTMHFRMSRYTENGQTYLRAALLDDNGEELFSNEVKDKTTDSNIKMLGIQAEHASFEVSNLALSNETEIVNIPGLRAALAQAEAVRDLEEDYTPETAGKLSSALTEVRGADLKTLSKEAVDGYIEQLNSAYNDLVLLGVTKATVSDTEIKFGETTYKSDEGYIDFAEIVAEIEQLNAREDIERKSDYRRAIEEILSRLVKEFTLTGEEGNFILNTLEGFNFTYRATQIAGYTYEWEIDGSKVENTTSTYELDHEFGEHTVKVTATKDQTKYEAEKKISIAHAIFRARSKDNNKAHVSGNVFTSDVGNGWGEWEGSNFLLDDLVFNGSFSVQADVKWKDWSANHNDGQVLTIHLLNADTLSPYPSDRDKAIVSYGAILLQNDDAGQRLEAKSGGNRWKFEDAYGKKLVVGDTFTIKLTAWKDTSNMYHVTFSLWNPTTNAWIDYTPTDNVSGVMEHGMLIGMNVENSAFEVSNFRYELLSDGTHQTGKVSSKVDLYNAIVEHEQTVREYYRYEGGVAFLKAYQAAYDEFMDNGDSAKYSEKLAALEEAFEALGDRKAIDVRVEGLDSGANKLRGNTYKAVVEGATEVYWTYDENGRTSDATLTLAAGAHNNIVLHFTVSGSEYTYQYQDVTVETLGARSGSEKVVVEQDKVTITDGGGWTGDQLTFENFDAQEFVLAFDIKRLAGHENDANSVVAIRTFEGGDDVTAVIGYKRDAVQGKMHIGYNQGTGYVGVFADDVRDSLWTDGAHVVLRQVLQANGALKQTFSIYKADGTFVASQDSIEYFHHFYTSTSVRFSFENINAEISNIQLSYLG